MAAIETVEFKPITYYNSYSASTMQAGKIFFDAFGSELDTPLPKSDVDAGIRLERLFSAQKRINVENFVGEVDSRVVAIASLRQRETRLGAKDVNYMHLTDFAVDREMRGKNIGSRFLGWLENEAAQEYGSQHMTLSTFAHNLSFYRNKGYGQVYVNKLRQLYVLKKDLTASQDDKAQSQWLHSH